MLECSTYSIMQSVQYSAAHAVQCSEYSTVQHIQCSAASTIQCSEYSTVQHIQYSAASTVQCSMYVLHCNTYGTLQHFYVAVHCFVLSDTYCMLVLKKQVTSRVTQMSFETLSLQTGKQLILPNYTQISRIFDTKYTA